MDGRPAALAAAGAIASVRRQGAVVAQQHRYSACDATPATGNNAMASLCADPFDEDLFRLAKIRFVQDVMRHHTTPVTFAADYRAGPPAAVTNF